MAVRRRKQETQLAFEAISIEGGLLSPDWLARVAQLQAANQTDADYAVPKGLNLRDEIGRYWRMAQAHWKDFAAGQAAGAEARLLEGAVVRPTELRREAAWLGLAGGRSRHDGQNATCRVANPAPKISWHRAGRGRARFATSDVANLWPPSGIGQKERTEIAQIRG